MEPVLLPWLLNQMYKGPQVQEILKVKDQNNFLINLIDWVLSN